MLYLYDVFGWDKSKFVHLPMIVGTDKKKLAKRHGSTQVKAFMEAGYLPEALINFIVLRTEVNVVRRTTRRMVASILSEYHCFTQRGGAWVFDAKKLLQGFDKSKRKFIAK